MANGAAANQAARLKVLNVLWRKKQASRMDVVRASHISLPTVTGILAEAEAEGYVIRAENGKPRGGRPPALYRFNPRARFAIGVRIHRDALSVGLVDLFETTLATVSSHYSQDVTPDFILKTLVGNIRELLTKWSVGPEKLLGIGLGVPGFLDLERGIWLGFPGLPAIKDVPLRSILEQEFQVPAVIRNDINIYAEAELRYGSAPQEHDMLLVTCLEGLKASVVVGGQILYGKHGNFGSVGHLIVVEDGIQCHCGTRGCLETYASGSAIRRMVAQDPTLAQRLGDPYDPQLPCKVMQMARAGDEQCRELVESFLPLMGRAFASMIRFTDIDTLVLLGIYAEGGEYLRQRLYEEISRHLSPMARVGLSIYLGGNYAIEKILAAATVPLIQAHLDPAFAST